MATGTKKTSPDYDPINEALDIGYKGGTDDERKRRKPVVESARRGGVRRGRADANKEARAAQERRAEKTRKANQRMRDNRARRNEEETASARRGAYAAGAAKAKRDAQEESRRVAQSKAAQTRTPAAGRSGSGASSGAIPTNVNVPSGAISGSGSGLSGGLTKQQGARIIIMSTGITAAITVAVSALHTAPGTTKAKVGNEVIKVPTHLRALGGVFVVGTMCLLLNEVSPGIGVALSLLLGIDTLATGFGSAGHDGVIPRFGNNIFQGAQWTPPPPVAVPPGVKGAPPNAVGTVQPPQGLQGPPVKVKPKPTSPWWNVVFSFSPFDL